MFTFGRANPVSDRNRYTGAKYKIFLLECPENAKTIMQQLYDLRKRIRSPGRQSPFPATERDRLDSPAVYTVGNPV